MADWAAALAGGLAARGVGAGDVVGLLSYNNIEFLATIFAANYLGAIAMPINWRLAAPELRFILEHSEARALVCDDALVELANEATTELERRPRPRVHLDRRTSPAGSGSPISAPGAVARPACAGRGDDVHRLMYTSGTTGRPKGVMITHANLAWKNYAHITEFGFTSADVGLACGPLYHVGALDLITTIDDRGGRDHHHPPRVRRRRVVDEIERSRVTRVWLAPAMVHAILDVPGIEERDLSSVRLIITGGEKMPIPFIERLRSDVPVGVVRRRVRPHRDGVGRHLPRPRQHACRSSAASAVRACTSSSTSGTSTARRCPPVNAARSCCAARRCSRATGAIPTRPSAAFAGGWFHTGDIGVQDDDGYLYIVDRLKDMIVSGGENIASSEVERVLYEHESVVEAAVVGRPDDRWGEVPVAYVVVQRRTRRRRPRSSSSTAAGSSRSSRSRRT